MANALTALFAATLSLTSPSQYTFTSNIMNAAFFKGVGVGSGTPAYKVVRLEDAAFLSEAFWERCTTFHCDWVNRWSHEWTIGSPLMGQSSFAADGLVSPLKMLKYSIGYSGLGGGILFQGSTNAVDGSFFVRGVATPFNAGLYNVTASWRYNGESVIGNVRPFVATGAKFAESTFPSNALFKVNEPFVWNGSRMTDCYALVGMIKGGVEMCPSLYGTYDYDGYNSEETTYAYTPATYTTYTWTSTDETGKQYTHTDSYASTYDSEEEPNDSSWSRSNLVMVGSSPYPHPYRERTRTTARHLEIKKNSYSYGERQTVQIIDNGYGMTLNRDYQEYSSMAASTIRVKSDVTYHGFYAAYRYGTRFGNGLNLWIVARGIAKSIRTQTKHLQYHNIQTNIVTVTTNTYQRFVNIVKVPDGDLTINADNGVIEFHATDNFNASIKEASCYGLTTLFSNCPSPVSLTPDTIPAGTYYADEGTPVSTATDTQRAEVEFEDISLWLHSRPTFHATFTN